MLKLIYCFILFFIVDICIIAFVFWRSAKAYEKNKDKFVGKDYVEGEL